MVKVILTWGPLIRYSTHYTYIGIYQHVFYVGLLMNNKPLYQKNYQQSIPKWYSPYSLLTTQWLSNLGEILSIYPSSLLPIKCNLYTALAQLMCDMNNITCSLTKGHTDTKCQSSWSDWPAQCIIDYQWWKLCYGLGHSNMIHTLQI